MGVYIKNWSLADWKELLKWAKIGANNAMIGEFTEVEEVPPHGRLIDVDALSHDLDFDVENDQRALDEMNFVGKERERTQFDKDCKQNCMWYLSNAPTIIPASEEEMK